MVSILVPIVIILVFKNWFLFHDFFVVSIINTIDTDSNNQIRHYLVPDTLHTRY